MPLLASFEFDYVKRVFERFGIFLLEDFGDGQTRWGNQPMTSPYTALSLMANRYGVGFDLFTIRNIAHRLGLGQAKVMELEREIEKYFEQNNHA
jgi:hypothetical protein